jgi:hypothetical protein
VFVFRLITCQLAALLTTGDAGAVVVEAPAKEVGVTVGWIDGPRVGGEIGVGLDDGWTVGGYVTCVTHKTVNRRLFRRPGWDSPRETAHSPPPGSAAPSGKARAPASAPGSDSPMGLR